MSSISNKKNKVKTYTYGNKRYHLFYDRETGSHTLERHGFISHTIVFDGTPAGGGGFNEEGANDSNLSAAGLQNVQNDILKDINTAFQNSGGTANGSVLPAWVDNKKDSVLGTEELDEEQKGSVDVEPWIGFDAELFANDFGGTDNILQKLSLRNLKYPIDADYGNTQDYIQINQFTYKAPNRNVIFGSENTQSFAGQITKGIPTTSKIEKPIGLVKLPMPNDLKDTNNVSWDQDQMNTLTAAMAGAVMRGIPGAYDTIGDVMSGNFGEAFQQVKNAAGGVLGEGKEIFKAIKTSGSQAQAMANSMIGSSVLNMIGFGASAESILARGFGVIPNDNMELLFRSPTLREFTFSWIISPRSREEAKKVNNIIRFFKQGMAVKKKKGTAGGASLFLHTPNVFDIAFKTSKYKNELTNENISVMKIKTCALVSCGVEYTPGTSGWQAYEKGQPVSVTMALRFKELEPIFDTDYSDNYFDFMDREDLDPVSPDAVGY
tara:strand:+ start:538 stop:2013 length:1476 start_codon:yes stop_codon:yes gene_type:complete